MSQDHTFVTHEFHETKHIDLSPALQEALMLMGNTVESLALMVADLTRRVEALENKDSGRAASSRDAEAGQLVTDPSRLAPESYQDNISAG